MNKFICIDVGNTNISCCKADGKKIFALRDFSHKNFSEFENYVNEAKLNVLVLCSVVPTVTKKISAFAKKNKFKLYVCGQNIKIPIINKYRKPAEVGQDRLLNVYGAVKIYGKNNIKAVIDLGTALTFDFIGKAGEYDGGLIFPGMRSALKALLNDCALLPDNLMLKSAKRLRSESTAEGINNGIIFGYSFLIKGFVNYLKKQENVKNYPLLLTGGAVDLLKKDICEIDFIEKDFSLKALSLLGAELKLNCI